MSLAKTVPRSLGKPLRRTIDIGGPWLAVRRRDHMKPTVARRRPVGMHADLQMRLPLVARAPAYVDARAPTVTAVRMSGQPHLRAELAELVRKQLADPPVERCLRKTAVGGGARGVARLLEPAGRYGPVDLVGEPRVAQLMARIDHDPLATQGFASRLGGSRGRGRLGRRAVRVIAVVAGRSTCAGREYDGATECGQGACGHHAHARNAIRAYARAHCTTSVTATRSSTECAYCASPGPYCRVATPTAAYCRRSDP